MHADRSGRLVERVRADAREARVATVVAWPLLQGAAAATLAWLVAVHIADHDEPFFAPIAAVIALNAPVGERGTNAIRLLLGVFVGIAVAEITLSCSAKDSATELAHGVGA